MLAITGSNVVRKGFAPCAVLTLCALPLAVGAHAEDRLVGSGYPAGERPVGSGYSVIEPPAKWQFEPIDPVEIIELPQAQIISFCSVTTEGYEQFGCTRQASPESPHCRIFIAREAYENFKKRLVKHEIAHCNGWPGDHPMD
jgi:hypothetical protein